MADKKEKYIMHLDGDAFFVSVEMAKNPALRGRPVVTGQERGIASALSYEAKAIGITRGMPVFQIRKEYPQVIVVSSDYESYAVFSRRMMDIVRRYTDIVEEYSIDECFAEFEATPQFLRDKLLILERLKEDIKRELGISVSLGLGPTKVIAKTASKSNKPDGLTIVPKKDIPKILDKTPVGKIWGIGSATAFALRKKGVSTALELARKPVGWVSEYFSKPMVEMWHELNGVSIHAVSSGPAEAQKMIMKTRTFGPASRDKAYVFSQISKNIEHACHKARELGLSSREFSIYLKTSDFRYKSASCRLIAPTNAPFEIIKEARTIFDSIFDREYLYRATGVTLYGLLPEEAVQNDLWSKEADRKESMKVLSAVDRLNRKYGRSVVHIASSSRAIKREEYGDKPLPFMPKNVFKRLSIPYLGEAE